MTMRRHASPVFVSAGALSLLIFALGFAQNPNQAGNNQADNIVPLSASIETLNARLKLPDAEQECDVSIPYSLDGQRVFLFPVWVASSPQISDRGSWRPLGLVEPLPAQMNGQPTKLRFWLKNLLADPKTRELVRQEVRQELANSRKLKDLQFIQPRFDDKGFELHLFVAQSSEIPEKRDPPICVPVSLSSDPLSQPKGSWAEITLDDKLLGQIEHQRRGQVRLADVRLSIKGLFYCRFETTQLDHELSVIEDALVELRNRIKPRNPKLGQPRLFACLPVRADSELGQNLSLRQVVSTLIQIEIRERGESLQVQKSAVVESLLERLLSIVVRRIDLSEQNDNTVVCLLIGQQATITGTIGEIKKLSHEKKEERQKRLKKLLEDWDAHKQRDSQQKWDATLEIDFLPTPVRGKMIPIPVPDVKFQGQKKDQEQEKLQRHEQLIDLFEKALDELKGDFEGRVPVVTGIRLDQDSLNDRVQLLKAKIKEIRVTEGRARYEWQPLLPQGYNNAEELVRLEQAATHLSEERESLEKSIKQAENLRDYLNQKRAEIQKGIDALGQQAVGIQERIQALNKQLDETEANAVKKELQMLRQQVDSLAAQSQHLKEQLSVHKRFIGELDKALRRDLEKQLAAQQTKLKHETLLSRLLDDNKLPLPAGAYALSLGQDFLIAAINDTNTDPKAFAMSIVDPITRKEVRRMDGHQGMVMSLALTPDGRYVVSGSWDGTVQEWDLQSGESYQLTTHKNGAWSVAMTADGRYVISGGGDGKVRVWNREQGKEEKWLDAHKGPVWAVAVTPDGRYVVSGGGDKTIRVWDWRNNMTQELTGHDGVIRSVAVTPDARYVVSGSSDNTVRVWSRETGKEVRKLEGHTDVVTSVAVTPTGRFVISGSHDKTVRVWNLRTGEEVRKLGEHENFVMTVVVTPDGRFVLSGGADNTVRVWYIGDLK
jgi:predicted  nucleic acid-binding Zn-ribbon protein